MPSVIVDFPVKLPAKCANCASPYSRDGRKYVDTHIDVRKYGRIYICTLCFSEIALALGYQPADVIHMQTDILIARADRIAELEVENDRLNTIISGGLDFLRAMDERKATEQDSIWITPTGEKLTIVDPARGNAESSVHPTAGERVTSVRKSGSTEPSEGSGPPNVPTTLKIDL